MTIKALCKLVLANKWCTVIPYALMNTLATNYMQLDLAKVNIVTCDCVDMSVNSTLPFTLTVHVI